jgi:O-antigen/teichoic acid export membrane protein
MNIKKTLLENRTFLFHILLTTFFGAIISFLNYLFSVYLARNISEYDFGLYNAALGLIYLIQIPAIAIQAAITKKIAQKRDFNLSKFKKDSFLTFFIVAIVLSSLFYLFRYQISDIANLPVKFMIPLTITLFSAILSPLSKGFLLGLEKIVPLNIILLLETIVKFALGYITVKMSLDITLPILATSLPALLSMLLVLPFLNSNSIKLPTKKISLEYKPILLMFVTFFLINTPYTLDLILVNPEVRAEYGALSLLGKVVYFAAVTIASVMFSRLSNQSKEKRSKTLLISLIFTALTGLAISLGYYLFSEQIVDIVFKGQYLGISKYMGLYGLAMTSYAIAFMIINAFLVNDSYKHIPFLLLLTILQVILFKINNNSLQDAFNNQLVVYGILTIFVFVILIFNIFRNDKIRRKENSQ